MSRLKKGINDLETVNPILSKEWDYTQNDKTPSDYTYGSHQKVWWICSSCGESWCAEINTRNRGNGCPNCRYKKSAQSTISSRLKGGRNTLRAANPSFLSEWDADMNGTLTPDDVTPHSSKKYGGGVLSAVFLIVPKFAEEQTRTKDALYVQDKKFKLELMILQQ